MASGENTEIASTADLIGRIQENDNVLAILQYGSGIEGEGADTDLCLVVKDRPQGLEGIHFWTATGPVDLNIRTVDELRDGGVEAGFDDVLREGEVVYERTPGTLTGICGKPQPRRALPGPGETARMRHGHAHFLSKLDFYKDRDPLLCRLLLSGAVHGLLRTYVAVREVPWRGEKPALEAMRTRDEDMLVDLETASANPEMNKRIEAVRRLTERVLEPIGGPWRRNEVLFFHQPGAETTPERDWRAFFESVVLPEKSGRPDS